jgi:hypothetical protein
MFGIPDLRDAKQAYMRGANHAKAAYNRFEAGEGWVKIAQDYKTSPYYMEKACKHYATRLNLTWPPRNLKPTKPLGRKAKVRLPSYYENKEYQQKVTEIKKDASYYYKRYGIGFTTDHLSDEAGIKIYNMVKMLSNYAKAKGFKFPMDAEEREHWRVENYGHLGYKTVITTL